MKKPRRLVLENSIVYGYRGYPSRYLKLECGHYASAQYYSREAKYVPNKTRMICYKCVKALREAAQT